MKVVILMFVIQPLNCLVDGGTYGFQFCFPFRSNIVKEAAWTVSNITAGNPDQIQLVIDAQILQPLIEVLVRVS